MSSSKRLGLLRTVAELTDLDASSLRSLLRFVDEVYVAAGVMVAQEGRLCHEFFIVSEGQLEICRRGRASLMGPGDAFGWRAMRDRGRHDATVVTLSPARLLVMSHEQFRAADALALAG